MLAVVVETKELAQTVVASLVGGVGVTVIFSIAIWGSARFAELSRGERPLAAAGAAAGGGGAPGATRGGGRRRSAAGAAPVAVLALAATAASVVLGIVVMTSK